MIKIKKWNQHLEKNLIEINFIIQKIYSKISDETFTMN